MKPDPGSARWLTKQRGYLEPPIDWAAVLVFWLVCVEIGALAAMLVARS